MAYRPRSALLARLEDWYGVRLISADVIHDVDLAAIVEALDELEEEIARLNAAMDDVQHELNIALEGELDAEC